MHQDEERHSHDSLPHKTVLSLTETPRYQLLKLVSFKAISNHMAGSSPIQFDKDRVVTK